MKKQYGPLKKGDETFTLLQLLEKAAAHKRLKLQKESSRMYSEPIAEYNLNKDLLAILAEQGIIGQNCPNNIFTLVDKNPQQKIPGFAPSNYWNFQGQDGDMGGKHKMPITLCVEFRENIEKRGIELFPVAHATLASGVDRLPNYRIFKALISQDSRASVVTKELAASNGSIIVNWGELGLGGIRRLSDLFSEFAKNNEEVRRLAHDGRVFDPQPFKHVSSWGHEDVFVIEPAQPKIFETWREQLQDYRQKLAIA